MATLARWEPFRELASIQNEMSRLLNAFEGNGQTTQNWVPALDVWETDDELVYAFDLPGVPKENVTIEYDDGMLTLSAKRERTFEKGDDRFYRFERRFGTFTRSIGLPQGVNEGSIRADFKDGVLEVHVAKPEEVKPRRIEIGGESQPTIEGSATASA
ncbi:MAG: Hsp20/alpha crystallin family protein [Thermoleophilia bacterium]|nr:Hsp20/alpha crystallin family protein [Thermoleophilia bacterium]